MGLLLAESSLVGGYKDVASIRSPQKFSFSERVHMVEGNAFAAASVRLSIERMNAVLSAMGARSLRRKIELFPY